MESNLCEYKFARVIKNYYREGSISTKMEMLPFFEQRKVFGLLFLF